MFKKIAIYFLILLFVKFFIRLKIGRPGFS